MYCVILRWFRSLLSIYYFFFALPPLISHGNLYETIILYSFFPVKHLANENLCIHIALSLWNKRIAFASRRWCWWWDGDDIFALRDLFFWCYLHTAAHFCWIVLVFEILRSFFYIYLFRFLIFFYFKIHMFFFPNCCTSHFYRFSFFIFVFCLSYELLSSFYFIFFLYIHQTCKLLSHTNNTHHCIYKFNLFLCLLCCCFQSHIFFLLLCCFAVDLWYTNTYSHSLSNHSIKRKKKTTKKISLTWILFLFFDLYAEICKQMRCTTVQIRVENLLNFQWWMELSAILIVILIEIGVKNVCRPQKTPFLSFLSTEIEPSAA